MFKWKADKLAAEDQVNSVKVWSGFCSMWLFICWCIICIWRCYFSVFYKILIFWWWKW